MAEPHDYVLDTSAVMALRGDEPGVQRVERLLRAAGHNQRRVFVSFMTRMELLYRITRDEGEDAATSTLRLLESTRVEWISCEPAILREAAHIKASGGLSVADAWIAATALVRKAVLVHKDPEFRIVPSLAQEQLGRSDRDTTRATRRTPRRSHP